jgi:hypothetical protein
MTMMTDKPRPLFSMHKQNGDPKKPPNIKNISTYGAGAQQVTNISLKHPATSSLIPNGPAGIVGPAERIFPTYPSLHSPHDKL